MEGHNIPRKYGAILKLYVDVWQIHCINPLVRWGLRKGVEAPRP
jgi:hypothetical protein